MLCRLYKDKKTGRLFSENQFDSKNENYEKTLLVFETETKIVYYKFIEEIGPWEKARTGCMTSYLGCHGRACKFLRGKIVEVE